MLDASVIHEIFNQFLFPDMGSGTSANKRARQSDNL